MPKPVLSDSLFNADDVATAVLSEANLQVSNSDLGVVDRSSLWSYGTGFSSNNHDIRAYSFNGFMFLSLNCVKDGISNEDTVVEISDSDYYPNQRYSANTISYEGDSGFTLDITTAGEVNISLPVNNGNSNFYVVANFWYRFTST